MHKAYHFLSRFSLKAIEITVGVAIVIMVVLGFCLWQMSQKPFDLMFAERYIEYALSTDEFSVNFQDVDLKWPGMKGPLRLDIKGLELNTPAGETALSVEQVDIGLSTAFLMIGMIRPVSIYLSGPTLRIIEDDAGRITFLLQGQGTQAERTLGDDEAKPLGEQIRNVVEEFAEPSEDGWLRPFRFLTIEKALVVLQDRESAEEVSIAELNARFRRTRRAATVEGDLISHEDRREGLSGISFKVAYDRQKEEWSAQSAFRNLGPDMTARLFAGSELLKRQSGAVSGRIALTMDKDERLTAFSGSVRADAGEIFWPQEYDDPIRISALNLGLGFDAATQTIRSETFDVKLQDVPVQGTFAMQIRPDGYYADLSLTVPEIEQATLESFFPKSELDGELAEWLVHRMDGGVFRNVKADIPLAYRKQVSGDGVVEWDVLFDEADMHVAFEADGVNLRYQDTLMPAQDIKGHGFFDGQKLDITGESGRIDDVQAGDIRVVVDNIAVKAGGYATIALNAKGPLSTVLRYIADEPIGMGDDVGFKPDEVKGNVDIRVHVGLPTLADLPKEQVDVKVAGTLNELYLPKVVEGLALSEGPLELETLPGGFTLKGDARLDGHPVTLDMTQYFNAADRDFLTKVEAKIVSNADLRNKFGVDLSDYISGDLPLDILYTDTGKGRETVVVKGDLGPTLIHINPFRYAKKAGVAGTLALDAVMENGRLTQVNNLSLETSGFSLDKGMLTFRLAQGRGAELSGGRVPTARIGKSVASVEFEITPQDFLKITATSPVFDATPFLGKGAKAGQGGHVSARKDSTDKGQAMSIALTADKVLAEHGREASALKLYSELDTDGDITRIEMTGRVGESDAAVLFRPDPQTGERFFRLETADGGALLAAAGLYENIVGGTLYVFGQPERGDSGGNLFGTAQLENFRVVRAPALAKLLSLMSLSGIGQALGQQGLTFSKLEADFEWQFRPEGNMLLISNGRTSGSSVGLTFEGSLDRGQEITDIRGTIIPMTEINNVLKNIPLIGDILTGGSGLIAATYTMQGPSADPRVMVNPLSVLAPGFLRTLLFEGGYNKARPGSASSDAGQGKAAPPPSPSRTAGQ